MKNTKRVFKIIIISVITILLLVTNVYGAVEVTEENFNEALQKMIQKEGNDSDYKITTEDNIIKVISSTEEFEIKYDLKDKPTFIMEAFVQNGMSYDEFQAETEKMLGGFIGYAAVSYIQGVKFETSTMYLALSYLEAVTKNESLEKIVVVDDTKLADGVTIEKKDDPNTYYASEFSEKVMEYTNRVYKDKFVINDADKINSFEITFEQQEVTENSCKLVSTLVVNPNADFSKLNEENEGVPESGITKENVDYTVELKVGQKCKIESSEKIRGYSIQNNSSIKFSEDYTEITAIKEGVATGYLFIGENEQKTIYIKVVENKDNEKLEPVVLKVGDVTNTEKTEENDKNDENKDNEFIVTVPDDKKEEDNNTTKDETIVTTPEIPKAGAKNIMFILIGAIAFVAIIGSKVKKYKGI